MTSGVSGDCSNTVPLPDDTGAIATSASSTYGSSDARTAGCQTCYSLCALSARRSSIGDASCPASGHTGRPVPASSGCGDTTTFRWWSRFSESSACHTSFPEPGKEPGRPNKGQIIK